MTNDPSWRKRLRKKNPTAVTELNRRYSQSEAGKAALQRRYQKRRDVVAAEKARRGGVCEDCGWEDDLVWHHRVPAEKKFVIGYAIIKSYAAIEDELAKCDLLCPNCHARRHRLMKEGADGVSSSS